MALNKKGIAKVSIIVLLVLILLAGTFLVIAESFNPEDTREIGYEFLSPTRYPSEKEIVHIWNTQDDYFFDRNSGIQFTNHFRDYWTKNIFCIGYYTGEIWHKIKCADELTNFNKNIQTDNLTYINVTLWKDFSYGSYDLRLGVQYHLGLDDENLSITIYGKNIGVDIPFDLGFAWKFTDWEIPHEGDGKGGDSIFINNTDYDLDGTFDLTFKNMTKIYYDFELEENITESIPYFRAYDYTKFLRVDWNENLNYAVKIVGNGNQEDFYVALLINVGHFNSGQEKSTTFQWIDAEGDYIGEFWDVNFNVGVDIYGDYIYGVSYSTDEVYKYTLYGLYTGEHWDTAGDENTDPRGLTTNGTYIWISDESDDLIYKYDMDGNLVDSWDTILDGCENPWGLTNNGTDIWVIGAKDDSWCRYDMEGNFLEIYDFGAVTNNDAPIGITTNNTYIWISDTVDKEVYKYNMDGTYTGESFDTSSNIPQPYLLLTQDGEYFYITTYLGVLYKYEMEEIPFSPLEGVAEAYINLTGIVNAFKLTWVEYYSGNFDEFGGIVIEDDVGYTMAKSLKTGIIAFNATSGKFKWTNPLGWSDGTPLIDNQGNYIFINTGYDGIYKLNKTNGSIITSTHACNPPSGYDTAQSMAQSDDLIFDTCFDGKIYAYNKNDLSTNWSYDTTSDDISMTPLYFEGTVTVGNDDREIFNLNATTGAHIWNYTISSGFNFWDTQPSVSGGVIYISSRTTTLALNFTNGSVIWDEWLGAITQHAIYDGKVFFGNEDGILYARNLNDGSANCSYDVGGILGEREIYQGPSISGGIVFFGSRDHYFYAINASDCNLLWKYNVGGDVFGPPAIAQGIVYFKADDYKVYAFDVGEGTGDWKQIGYDDSGVSYCTDCLTSFQGVNVDCESISATRYNCTIVNSYGEKTNISLISPTLGNWYDSSVESILNSSLNVIISVDATSSSSALFELDVIPPYFTIIPSNDLINYGVYWSGVDFNATDESGFGTYTVNSSDFTIDSSGFLNMTTLLLTGIHNLNITINDTSNNLNSTIYTLTISQCGTLGTANEIYTLLSDVNVTGTCWIINADNITIKGAGYNITGDGGEVDYGIYSNGYNNLKVYNLTISNFGDSIYLEDSDNVYIQDSNISDNVNNAIYMVTNSLNATLLNVSYAKVDESIGGGSDLTRYWYFSIQTNYTHNGTAVNGATVIGLNTTETQIFTDTTDGNGRITTQNLIEYINLAGVRDFYTNYTINVTKSGWDINSQSINLTTNYLNQQFNISDTVIPYISLTFPLNISYSTNISRLNYTFIESAPDSCWYSLDAGITNTSATTCGSTNWTGLNSNEGSNTWIVYINDTLNNVNSSSITFYKDTIYPQISISFPSNNTNSIDTRLDINYTATDTNIDSCWYSNDTMNVNVTLASCTTNITGLTWAEGQHNVTIWVNDTVNNINSTSITFTIDTTAPVANLTYPLNNTYNSTLEQNFTFNVSDNLGVRNATWYIWNSTGEFNTTITTFASDVLEDTVGIVITLVEGIYNWWVQVWDWAGNTFITDNRTITIDITYPQLSIAFPANYSNHTDPNLNINYTATDTNIDSCWYSNDTMNVNVTLASCTTNITGLNWSDGQHNVTIWANDSANNINSTSVTFTIDTTPPNIIIDEPQKAHTYIINQGLLLNYTVTDTLLEVSSCWYNIINSTGDMINISGGNDVYAINTTLTTCLNSTFNISRDDDYVLTFYSNDSLNNVNSTNVSFSISTIAPAVNLDAPSDNSYLNNGTNIYFNFTATDSEGLDTCKLYSNWNGSWSVNYTWIAPTNATMNWTIINLIEDTYKWNVGCNDTTNNFNFALTNYTVTIDETNPNIDFITANRTAVTGLSIDIYYNISDTNIDICYFTLRSSGGLIHNYAENTSIVCGNTLRRISTLGYGTYAFQLWGEDLAGNLNQSILTFTTQPVSTPPTPSNGRPPYEPPAPVVIVGICGNNLCEEGYGEFFYTCPQDCGGLNIDDLILSCFEEDPQINQKCIVSQAPVLFYLAMLLIIIIAIAIIVRIPSVKKRMQKIREVPKNKIRKKLTLSDWLKRRQTWARKWGKI